jgi:indole-3-acetate monooxygenase
VNSTGMSERREEIFARAGTLAPEFQARAAEGEINRTMPADLAAKVKKAGLFRLSLPASLGGWEVGPVTLFEVIEKLSHADGSAGWTVLIGNNPSLMAWLDPAVAARMLNGDPDICASAAFAPLGRAVPDGNGSFTVTGRWPCNSGCPHSEWFLGGVLVMDGDQPRTFRRDGRTIALPGSRAPMGRSSTRGMPRASREPEVMMSLCMGSRCRRS